MGGDATGPLSIDILRTRLLPPRLPPSSLFRNDLVDRLVAGLAGRLVVVVAAAGYGKSTLLAQALAVGDGPWVWCSCDPRLATPPQLLAHIDAGVRRLVPGSASTIRAGDPTPTQVAALANALAAFDDDVVVALDDVHLLPPESASVLALLLSDLPPNVHLVLAGRERLPVPIARLRPNRLLEIGEAELAFSESEAIDLLYAAGLATGPEQAIELHRRTEGWAAGLLIGAHVEAPPSRTAGRSQEHVFEYLVEEVLARLPPELRRFLLATCVFDRFTPELADQLGEGGDSRRLARELVDRHLFTVRLQGDEEWYRYHGMMLSFLRRRLADEMPERVRGLHAAAGEALVAAGIPGEGIRHLLVAGADARAADVLDPIAEGMVRTPEAHPLAEWLERLPEPLRTARPALVAARGLLLHESGDHLGALDLMERAAVAFQRAGDAQRAGVTLLRLLQISLAGDAPERGVDATDRLVEMGAAEGTPHAAWMSFACCCVWTVLRRTGAARSLLVAAAGSGGFDAATAAEVCGSRDAPGAIEELERARLVSPDPAGGEPSWTVRPVLAAFLRAKAADRATSSRLARPAPVSGLVSTAAMGRPPIRILALGQLEVWRGEQPVPELAGARMPKSRTLLAIFLAAGRPVHRETLLDLLWPDLPQERALAALHTALHTLRRTLEPDRPRGDASTLIVTDCDTYRLVLDRDDSCDAHDLLRLARKRGVDGADCTARLVAVEEAYRGPFLAEWPYDDWAAPARAEVERARATVAEELAGRLVAAGDTRGAIDRYLWLLEADADRECVHRALMDTYARSGERALAVRQYHECRAVLRERHGLDPSPETQALYRRLIA
jgi:DNA-binding SARP family transcriptional activator